METQLDIKMIPLDRHIGIYGNGKCGKTTLAIDLIRDLDPADVVIFTHKGQLPLYEGFDNAHDHYDDLILEKLITTQQNTTDNTVTLVIDGFEYDKHVKYDDKLRHIFMNGRSLGIRIIITFRQITSLLPHNRKNLHCLFAFNENSLYNCKTLHNEFFKEYGNVNDFTNVLKRTTQNYGTLVSIRDATTYGSYKANLIVQ